METVKSFLSTEAGDGSGYGSGDGSGYGYGSGDGSGDGYGSGYGSGYGYGYGYGYGSGDGYGYGYGSGDGSGSGVKSFCGSTVYRIDGVQTLLKVVCENCAKGFILNSDLTLKPCYVVKQSNCFAHGKTLREAQAAVLEKIMENMNEEERIEAFWNCHNKTDKYPVKDFYDWHHKLTGSCEMGRNEFAKDHGIDLDNDMMTVDEFIKLTENAYGGEIIRKLKKET